MGLEIIDPTELAALRAIARPKVLELVAGNWPAPDGLVYYCSTQLDELPGFPEDSVLASGDLAGPIEPRLPAYLFQAFSHVSDIGDDTVQIELSDLDGAISDLFHTHGEGIKFELFYYFPQVDLLVSTWWGHLRPPDEADGYSFKAKLQSGFRSALMNLPRRYLGTRCGLIWGGRFTSQVAVDQSGCMWNLNVPGGTTGVPGSDLLGPCSQISRAVCTQYLGDALSFGGFETVVDSIVNNQTKGPGLIATSRGNETNLKRSLRLVYGHVIVRDLDLLAYTPQLNTNHPDQGFVRCLFAICEGPVSLVFNCKVNNSLIGFNQLNVRPGEERQPATFFSPNVGNYSFTAHFFGVYGPVNAAQYGPGNLAGEAEVYGLLIRIYSDADTFSYTYSTNRAWVLFDLYTNKRYGHGVSVDRFVIDDWIALADWCDEVVAYADASGSLFTGTRSTFNGEVNERSAQQQISDICMMGRFGLPFRHGGKVRIVPLQKETIDDSIPVFTDQGGDRNIIVDERGNSSLTWSQKSDADMVNQIKLTFIDAAHNYIERPLTFEDQDAQIRAGHAMGDDTVRVVSETYSAFGITNLGEAARIGNLLLDLGPFDQGGLQNNLTVRFLTADIGTALGLWKYRLIKIVSPKITRFGFQYFRVMERQRRSDLVLEITAQAYPVEYYENLEDIETPPPHPGGGGNPNPGGGPGDVPCPIGFRTLQHVRDYLDIELEIC